MAGVIYELAVYSAEGIIEGYNDVACISSPYSEALLGLTTEEILLWLCISALYSHAQLWTLCSEIEIRLSHLENLSIGDQYFPINLNPNSRVAMGWAKNMMILSMYYRAMIGLYISLWDKEVIIRVFPEGDWCLIAYYIPTFIAKFILYM